MNHIGATRNSVHHKTQRNLLERFVSSPWAFILPGFVLYGVIGLYPLFSQFYFALTDMQIATINDANFVGLRNFSDLARDPQTREVIEFTVIFVAFSVPLQFVCGFGLALLLNQKLIGRLAYRLAALTPWVISSVIIGLMWRLLLHESNAGAINAMLNALNLPTVAWFSDPTTARVSVIFVNVWRSVAFTMVFMLGGLQTLPQDVLEAATVDGANAWQKLIRVKLPILKTMAGLNLIYISIATFQVMETILVLTQGGPGRATSTLGYRMYELAFTPYSPGFLGRSAALGVILFVIISVFALTYMRMFLLQKDVR
jgi:ABC-type sugar transport system permease subunit